MARLDALPEQQIIDGFKGSLDYYLWKGIACCRKWPVWRPRTPTPLEAANQAKFTYAIHLWTDLPANIKDSWNDLAKGTTRTGRDLFLSAYLKGANV